MWGTKLDEGTNVSTHEKPKGMKHTIVVPTSPHVPKGRVIWIIPTSSFLPPSSPPIPPPPSTLALPPPSSPHIPCRSLPLSTPTYFLAPF